MLQPPREFSQRKIVLIITTTVFSFSAMTNAFYLMGLAALPWYLLTAICFFIPYAFIIAEYSYAYKDKPAGINDWLKDNLSENVATIATFLWYCSYSVWLVSLSMKIWIPFSILLFGRDLTQSTLATGLNSRLFVGILSIGLICFLTWLASSSFTKVATMMIISGKLILMLFIITVASQLLLLLAPSTTVVIEAKQLIQSPNPDYQSLIGNLSFFIFSITAFGGLDTVASLVDKLSGKTNRFSRGIVISAFLVVALYFLGILLWSISIPWSTALKDQQLNLGNVMYTLMLNLGSQVGQVLHLSLANSRLLGQLFLRLNGLVFFITYLGLLSTIIYTPLKTLYHSLASKTTVPKAAYWWQATIISLLILFVSLGGKNVSQLYNQLTLMTNLSRSIPYLMIALSFGHFHKGQTEIRYLKTSLSAKVASFSVIISISIGILFTLAKPLLAGEYLTVFFLILGPLLFTTLALLILRFQQVSNK
ncbi:glutamate/gamma-aminobutyrate family transporter YjeM [Vagococcus sp. BWB3-3]|uniref:Glutamate/gamma-aminobutyrate family transporter YjeM n=1 Tax=Vagococcus allomyrinae TaxID=2794353 RepID=A0A940SW58_9ENTE|nr:glutamate/gamma-aminobutyrate family transporter YjeM [Vagococcus allomyrinae]